MMNMQALLKQAHAMQRKMEEAQAKLADEEVVGASGNGAVEITLNGKFAMKKIHIDEQLLKDGDAEMLEDLIMVAYAEAHKKADEKMNEGMQSVTGGLNLGGMKLPF